MSSSFLNGLKPVKPFRGQFQYNNLGYEVAGHVIEKLSGTTWDQMLRSKIFEPLETHRTGTHGNFCGPENVSNAYGSLSNGTPVGIGDAQIGDNTVAGAAGGVRSSLNNMLKLMKVWLETGEHQFSTHLTSTPDSPLKQVNHIMSAQAPIGSPSYHETSYALGWVRTQLPAPWA
jgi:CubicO group peptidase (beta-lactamase class C family)